MDEIVLFKPLTLAEIERIVDLLLGDLRSRLDERRTTLQVTEEARRFIAEQGFDPAYGARPLRRVISVDVTNGELTVVPMSQAQERREVA